jgi:hypothetical protein
MILFLLSLPTQHRKLRHAGFESIEHVMVFCPADNLFIGRLAG